MSRFKVLGVEQDNVELTYQTEVDMSASNTYFDNTSNGFVSTTVQGAVEEVSTLLMNGITNFTLTANTAFITTSLTDVVVTGFSLTPAQGTYVCMLNMTSYLTTTPKAHWWSFYVAGVKQNISERTQDTSHSNQTMVDTTMMVKYFTGTQAIDVRVRTTNGSLTMTNRTMVLIRLGP
jgi:hypothetical protein